MPYVGGCGPYRKRCDEVAAHGYEGFVLGSARRSGAIPGSSVRVANDPEMADDGRTHLQEILGARASELSEASTRELTGFIDGGRPNAHLLAVAQARRRYDADSATLGPGEPIAESQEHRVTVADATLSVREFRPASGVLPAIVYIHGGGWLLGSIDSHQAACRALANASGCAVFSVGYRLAPEWRFPTAVEDCYAALTWVQARADALSIDPGRIAVAGDSAGGNLATVIAMLSRDRGGPRLGMQLLVYPVTTTDLSLGFDGDYEGFLLYRDEMQWHQDNYLGAGAEDRSVRLAAGPRQARRPASSARDHRAVRPASRAGRALRTRTRSGGRGGRAPPVARSAPRLLPVPEHVHRRRGGGGRGSVSAQAAPRD